MRKSEVFVSMDCLIVESDIFLSEIGHPGLFIVRFLFFEVFIGQIVFERLIMQFGTFEGSVLIGAVWTFGDGVLIRLVSMFV
jgi:hypothetical protein